MPPVPPVPPAPPAPCHTPHVNLLAHLYLADPGKLADGLTLFGNLLPDFWRGPLPGDLPPDLCAAADRHRRVDRFTDRHPRFLDTVTLLRPGWGRFAAVAADVFYDHALSLCWADYHPLPRDQFIAEAYTRLASTWPTLPEPLRTTVQPIGELMQKEDWLSRYATPAGITQTFEQMSRRLSRRFDRPVDLADPMSGFAPLQPTLLEQFDAFFPDIIQEVQYSNESAN